MAYSKTDLEGVYLFEPQVLQDLRGEFWETFRPDQCLAETGIEFHLAQVNTSVSRKGVIRGIHFKRFPPGQAKFVSVSSGSIVDVVVDLRRKSETFLQWRSFELSSENRKSLLVGYGLGHAFLSLEEGTKVNYLCDSVFEPELEIAINPMGAGIDWSVLGQGKITNAFEISLRDKSAPNIGAAKNLLFE